MLLTSNGPMNWGGVHFILGESWWLRSTFSVVGCQAPVVVDGVEKSCLSFFTYLATMT